MERRSLDGKSVAILATHGFEQSELEEPLKALREAGAQVKVVAPESGSIRGWKDGEWGDEVPVDLPLDRARSEDFDALVLPGGVMNPDKLRTIDEAKRFVRAFHDRGKPISAICHGPQVLIDCDAVDGREMTSYRSIRTDLVNAGAKWKDEEVVVDQGLTTSRSPADLPAFIDKTIEEIREGRHARTIA